MEQKKVNKKLYKWCRETFISASAKFLSLSPVKDQLSCSTKLYESWVSNKYLSLPIISLYGLGVEENKHKSLKFETLIIQLKEITAGDLSPITGLSDKSYLGCIYIRKIKLFNSANLVFEMDKLIANWWCAACI